MKLPEIKYPKFSTIIPSTGEKIWYRPYNGAEEKPLLTAIESGEITDISKATKDLLATCYENLDVAKLTSYDIDYLFLQVRIKSVSETSEHLYRYGECPNNNNQECEKTIKVVIKLDDAKIQQYNEETEKFEDYVPKPSKLGGDQIAISDEVGVILKYPGFAEQEKFLALVDPTEDDLISLCIVAIYDAETVYPRTDFQDDQLQEFYNSLIPKDKDKLRKYMRNIPVIRYECEFHCKECGKREPLEFQGLDDFFG